MATNKETYYSEMNALAASIAEKTNTSGTHTIPELKNLVNSINTNPPSGTKTITTPGTTDVATYANAYVDGTNIVAGNIKSGVTILGVEGTLVEGSGIVPSGTLAITSTGETDVTSYAKAYVNPTNITSGNIRSGVTILGVAGDYGGADYSQATATASDIVQGKTAYTANGLTQGQLSAGVDTTSQMIASNTSLPHSFAAQDHTYSSNIIIGSIENLSVNNIREGVSIAGVLGEFNGDENDIYDEINNEFFGSNYPVKGDIVLISMIAGRDPTKFRVLKNVSGTTYELVAMEPFSTGQKFDDSDNTYSGSVLDTALNETYYDLLTSTVKTAIVNKTFTPDVWNKDTTSSAGAYAGKDSASNTYYVIPESSSASSITRHVYALSVRDILDYLGTTTSMTPSNTTLTAANVWSMFSNQTTSPSLNKLWLSSAYEDFSNYAMNVDLAYGEIESADVTNMGSTYVSYPALQLDLSRVVWSPFNNTIAVSPSDISDRLFVGYDKTATTSTYDSIILQNTTTTQTYPCGSYITIVHDGLNPYLVINVTNRVNCNLSYVTNGVKLTVTAPNASCNIALLE